MNRLEKINELGVECAILIENFHYWEDRYFYIELMENYLNDKIDFEEFDKKFFELWSYDRDKENSWEKFIYIINNFKLNEFDDFSSLPSKLFTDLDVCELDPLFREDYEIDEDELRKCVKETLLEIKDRYA